MFIKGVILILMMVKAFYIVAYFMHLKHEIKNAFTIIKIKITPLINIMPLCPNDAFEKYIQKPNTNSITVKKLSIQVIFQISFFAAL